VTTLRIKGHVLEAKCPHCGRGVNLVQTRQIFLRLSLGVWMVLVTDPDNVKRAVYQARVLSRRDNVVVDIDGTPALDTILDSLPDHIAPTRKRQFETLPRHPVEFPNGVFLSLCVVGSPRLEV
jgi:hypothetical protein